MNDRGADTNRDNVRELMRVRYRAMFEDRGYQETLLKRLRAGKLPAKLCRAIANSTCPLIPELRAALDAVPAPARKTTSCLRPHIRKAIESAIGEAAGRGARVQTSARAKRGSR